MTGPANQAATRAAVAAGIAGLRAGRPAAMAAAVRAHLGEHIMPFWDERAWDDATGTLNTCVDDRGTVLSRDKWLWSQWRAVWVYSRLYRTIEPRAEWLERARRPWVGILPT